MSGSVFPLLSTAWSSRLGKDPDAETVLRQVQEDLGYAKHNPDHPFALPPDSAAKAAG